MPYGNLFYVAELVFLACIAWSVKLVARAGADYDARLRRANKMLVFWVVVSAALCVVLVAVAPMIGWRRGDVAYAGPVVVALHVLPALLGWRDARREARSDRELYDRS